jgi:hypothetical protein
MPDLLDWLSPAAWLEYGRSSLALALRTCADTLHALADAVDDAPLRSSARERAMADTGDDAALPREGTRERIAEALQRARSHLDSASAPTVEATPRPRE